MDTTGIDLRERESPVCIPVQEGSVWSGGSRRRGSA